MLSRTADHLYWMARYMERADFLARAIQASRRLAALEQRLGERLLLRTTRRQSLTEFGLQLLEHARQVVAEVEAVSALSERRQATPSGRLRVSMPSDFANLLLADTLAAFESAGTTPTAPSSPWGRRTAPPRPRGRRRSATSLRSLPRQRETHPYERLLTWPDPLPHG